MWNNDGDVIPFGSSYILPTPANPSGSIPLAAVAAVAAGAITGERKGGDIKVEVRTLRADKKSIPENGAWDYLFGNHDLPKAYLKKMENIFSSDGSSN